MIYNPLKKILYKYSDGNFSQIKEQINEIIAFHKISEWVHTKKYFPYTDTGIKFHSLAIVLNDLVLHQRKFMVEFGAGISTIAIAKILKTNQLNTKFISVEDNSDWIRMLSSYLVEEKIEGFVEFVHAPLTKSKMALDGNTWYDEAKMDEIFKNVKEIDAILIDGPVAFNKEIEMARFPALPFLAPKLSDSFAIFLDDVNREGEQKILKLWEKQFNLHFKIPSPSLAVALVGKNVYNIFF